MNAVLCQRPVALEIGRLFSRALFINLGIDLPVKISEAVMAYTKQIFNDLPVEIRGSKTSKTLNVNPYLTVLIEYPPIKNQMSRLMRCT